MLSTFLQFNRKWNLFRVVEIAKLCRRAHTEYFESFQQKNTHFTSFLFAILLFNFILCVRISSHLPALDVGCIVRRECILIALLLIAAVVSYVSIDSMFTTHGNGSQTAWEFACCAVLFQCKHYFAVSNRRSQQEFSHVCVCARGFAFLEMIFVWGV